MTEPTTDSDALKALGDRVAALRACTDATQSELAATAGVSRATVQRLEAGASTQLANLVRVLRALGVADDLDLLCRQPARPTAQRAERRKPAATPAGASTNRNGWTWGGDE